MASPKLYVLLVASGVAFLKVGQHAKWSLLVSCSMDLGLACCWNGQICGYIWVTVQNLFRDRAFYLQFTIDYKLPVDIGLALRPAEPACSLSEPMLSKFGTRACLRPCVHLTTTWLLL